MLILQDFARCKHNPRWDSDQKPGSNPWIPLSLRWISLTFDPRRIMSSSAILRWLCGNMELERHIFIFVRSSSCLVRVDSDRFWAHHTPQQWDHCGVGDEMGVTGMRQQARGCPSLYWKLCRGPIFFFLCPPLRTDQSRNLTPMKKEITYMFTFRNTQIYFK